MSGGYHSTLDVILAAIGGYLIASHSLIFGWAFVILAAL